MGQDIARRDRLPTFLMMVVLAAAAAFLTVGLGIRAGLAGWAQSPSADDRQAAIQAADVGLQYALARLEADPLWRGNSPGPSPYVRPGLSVVEEAGNVLGLLEPVDGIAAHFLLSFNLEDGRAGPDGLEDTPQGRLRLSVGRVSLNNLSGRQPLTVPGQETLPAASAYLSVEGLAAPGLSPPASGRVARRVLQAWFTLEAEGGGEVAVIPPAPPTDGGLRTLEGVDLGSDGADAGGGGGGDGFLGTGGSPRPSAGPAGTPSTPGVGGTFSEAAWVAIAKADARSPGDCQLRGGTYVWRVDSGGPYLEYFDQPPGRDPLPPAGDGIRVDGASLTADGRGLQLHPARLTLVLTRNTAVVPSEHGHRGLALRTDPLVTALGGWPQVVFQGAPGPILSAADRVRLEAAVSGRGAITSEGGLQVQGPSILDSQPGIGVSLYARGDLAVEAIPREVADLRQDFAQFVETWVLAHNALPTMGSYRAARQSGSDPAADPGLGLGASNRAGWELDPGLASPKLEQFRRILTRYGSLEYADQSLEGRLVTWGSFQAERGGRGVLHLAGAPQVRGQGPDRLANTVQVPDGSHPTRPRKLHLQRTLWSDS